MASRHHHLHGCFPPSTATTSTVCCCGPTYGYGCGYATPCHNSPSPDPHLHHHHHPSTHPNHHSTTFSNFLCTTHGFHLKHSQCYSPLTADFQREDCNREQGGLSHAQLMISSLLSRIADLESSLRHRAASRSQSLRDAAARTIQTHFRAFLVRRSRTLRQLKDLASIKSVVNVLKSSVSDSNRLDPLALSNKALHLLLKLDSIQGDDPMIRDGKKSIIRELTRFLDFIDGITVKRSELSSGFTRKNARQGEGIKKSRDLYSNKKTGNTSCSDKRLEDLVNRIEALYHKVPQQVDGEEDEDESPRISLTGKTGVSQSRNGRFRNGPDQSKVKKNVKFSEDGNVYYVPKCRNGPVLVEDYDGDDGTDMLDAKKKLDILRREAEEVGGISFRDTEDGEVAQSDDGDDQVSTQSSIDGERNLVYSAPLPVKMETRSDSRDERKTVKLVE